MYEEIAIEIPRLFRIYKDGRIDRFTGTDTVPPLADPETGVRSADVTIDPGSGLSARVFLPRIPDPARKLPLILYFHGGAFCLGSPYSPLYHRHVSTVAAAAEAVAVSVHYRLAPEHPLPAALDDAWAAAQWAASGPEGWVRDHADLGRVYVAGDSAGATLAHHVAMRAGTGGADADGLRIEGLVAVHPFFEWDEARPDKLLDVIFPTRDRSGDPRVNPGKDPGLGRIGCGRVLVCVAQRDFIRECGWAYYRALKKSGWAGELEILESEEEGHVFHLFKPTCDKAEDLVNRMVSFVKDGC